MAQGPGSCWVTERLVGHTRCSGSRQCSMVGQDYYKCGSL